MAASHDLFLHEIPNDAVLAGYDSEGHAIFAGVRKFNNNHTLLLLIPSKGIRRIGIEDESIHVPGGQFITGSGFKWVKANPVSLPVDIYCIGVTATRDPVFVGRTHFENALIPGEVDEQGSLRLPLEHKQQTIPQNQEYEVLVKEGSDWKNEARQRRDFEANRNRSKLYEPFIYKK